MVAEISDELEAQAIAATATNDPRSVTPPCILIVPPNVQYDYGCGGTGDWEIHCLAPGPANADAWKVLDELEAVCIKLYPIERRDREQYPQSTESQPLFGYRLTLTKGVS